MAPPKIGNTGKCIDNKEHDWFYFGVGVMDINQIEDPKAPTYIIIECRRCKDQHAMEPFNQEAMR